MGEEECEEGTLGGGLGVDIEHGGEEVVEVADRLPRHPVHEQRVFAAHQPAFSNRRKGLNITITIATIKMVVHEAGGFEAFDVHAVEALGHAVEAAGVDHDLRQHLAYHLCRGGKVVGSR
jgi:hypothetical protein